MFTVAAQRNIGSYLLAMAGIENVSVVAGGGNDNAGQNGLTIDRNKIDPVVLSGLFVLLFNATLGNDVTAVISCTFEDSADGSNWDAYDEGPGESSSVTITLDGARTAQFKCQLGGARRYIRAVPKVNISSGSVDTVAIRGGVWIFAGADTYPITETNAAIGISD